jgi:arylsulfatase A-like enzyme
VRRDWAQYYDNITTMDKQVQVRLTSLKDGLAEDTVVFFGDHGAGMPSTLPLRFGTARCVAAVFPKSSVTWRRKTTL